MHIYRVINFVVSKVKVNKNTKKKYFFHDIPCVLNDIHAKVVDSFEVIFFHFLAHIAQYLSHNLTNVGFLSA